MPELRYKITVEMAQFFDTIAKAAREVGELDKRVAQLVSSLSKLKQTFKYKGDIHEAFVEYTKAVGGLEKAAGVTEEAFRRAVNQFYDFGNAAKRSAGIFRESLFDVSPPTRDIVRSISGDVSAFGSLIGRVLNATFYTTIYTAIFSIFMKISNALSEATKRAYEFSEAIFRINNAARSLRESGIDVTAKGLFQMADRLRTDLGALGDAVPKSELLELVSTVALMTQQMRLSEEEIYKLARAIVILNRASAETETVQQTARKVISSLISSGRGAGTLGVAFPERLMRQKAIELGLISRPEDFGKLTQEQVYRIKFEILVEDAEKKAKDLGDAFDYPSVRADVLKAKISDAFTAIGNVLNSLVTSFPEAVTAFATLLQLAAKLLEIFGVLVIAIEKGVEAILVIGFYSIKLLTTFGANNFLKTFRDFLEALLDVRSRFLESVDRFLIGANPERLLKDAEKLPQVGNAFMEMAAGAELGAEGVEKAVKSVESDINSLLNLYERMKRKREDFEIETKRAEEDFARDLARLDEDYRRRIAEEEGKNLERRRDLIEKFNLWLIAEEERKNEQLRQLRERFLLDLEDAVRKRDAVAIIRSTKNYLMERQNIINEFNLRVAERRRMLEYELAQIRDEVNRRIAELEREWVIRRARMIEEHNIKMARMREDFAREMAELRRQITLKIAEIADGISRELGLRQQGAQMVYNILLRYLGPGGYVDSIYQHSILSATNAANRIIENLKRILATLRLAGGNTGSIIDIGGQAQGGVYFASSPTRAVFGEAGPELAIFLPLSKALGNLPQQHTVGGRANITILLQPGLEGKIAEQTLSRLELHLKRWKGVGP